jgi:hypothetical protein
MLAHLNLPPIDADGALPTFKELEARLQVRGRASPRFQKLLTSPPPATTIGHGGKQRLTLGATERRQRRHGAQPEEAHDSTIAQAGGLSAGPAPQPHLAAAAAMVATQPTSASAATPTAADVEGSDATFNTLVREEQQSVRGGTSQAAAGAGHAALRLSAAAVWNALSAAASSVTDAGAAGSPAPSGSPAPRASVAATRSATDAVMAAEASVKTLQSICRAVVRDPLRGATRDEFGIALFLVTRVLSPHSGGAIVMPSPSTVAELRRVWQLRRTVSETQEELVQLRAELVSHEEEQWSSAGAVEDDGDDIGADGRGDLDDHEAHVDADSGLNLDQLLARALDELRTVRTQTMHAVGVGEGGWLWQRRVRAAGS